ncbi:MAG TPA: Stk1 family PASTA domain-containing Ser/Thr kinase [Acidimicrobiales bacterium]|jgi:serine/threonine-protein kinase|nr:Stk1 family PASTA domain-containing Ser/Thr kinase [Acidimicrobiales bacterium]
MEPVTAPRTFSGRYEVTHLIARGGMAQVFRALDLRLGRHVALKVLFPELSVDRTFVERFRREAQAAANLSHPNVVAVYDWGEDEGTYFIVMELITGTSLATALRTERTLPATRAASIAAQVASALTYAHRHGVVHRDIKPGNVMLTDDGQVKVTDFGIAQAVSTEEGLTMAGSVMGTAAYFSPEQAEGAVVDGRSDVYSLGIVLYEMLAGRTPFVGDSPVAVASMHVRNTPPLLRDLNPAVPADIEAVTMRALAKAPDDRYQSAEEFRSDLLRFTEGQPVLAEGVTQVVGVAATSVLAADTTAVLPPRDSTVVVPAVGPLDTGITAIPSADEALLAPIAVMEEPVRDVATKPASSPQSKWLAALLVLALLVAGFFVYRGLSGATTLSLPNVIGLPYQQAVLRLQGEGFAIRGKTYVTSTLRPGEVAKTIPRQGAQVKPGAKVELFVSKGNPVPVTVPSVAGHQLATAQSILSMDKLGFKEHLVPSWPSPVVPGSVLAQSPLAGMTALSQTAVTLTVLAPGGTYPVPDVVGQAPAIAGATLTTYGLIVGQTTSACTTSSGIVQGDVTSTTPAAPSPVQAHAVVNLTVSSGACPVSVPDLYNLTPLQATQAINRAQLAPYVMSTCSQPGYTPTGLIVSQSPLAEQPARPGSPVYAYVGCTPPSSTTTSSTLPPGATPIHPDQSHQHGRFRRRRRRD